MEIKKEIQWVMRFKDHPVTRSVAEAIVDHRLCSVEISFEREEKKWRVAVFRDGRLIHVKKSAFSNPHGVVSGLWHFVGTEEKIPWMRLLEGGAWRTEHAILDYLFWRNTREPEIEILRDFLFRETESVLFH